MTETLVDTNILLDVSGPDSPWRDWSDDHLAEAADTGGLVINQVIYAELASGYGRREELDIVLTADRYRREDIPWDGAFMAGLAFLE